ncbi:hypothetical protein B0T21DRAFT_310104, partial [Apiosordaria backusii]
MPRHRSARDPSDPTGFLFNLLIGPYLNVVAFLLDKFIIPHLSSAIIRLGRGTESFLRVPQCIRVFHPLPIEPGMHEDDMRDGIEGM